MNFEIIFLGTNSAIPDIKSFSSAQLLVCNHEPYLIDCGEGTQIRLRQFYNKFSKIKNIFISHLHGDHYFGIFGLISTFNLLNRSTDLNIYCDHKLEKILTCEHSIIDINTLSFKINVIPLPESFSEIYKDRNISVYSFPLNHKIPTWGFLFKEKAKPPKIIKEKIEEYKLSIEQIKKLKAGKDIEIENKIYPNSFFTIPSPSPRTYAYCSDTTYDEKIAEYIANIDILYHETTFLNNQSDRAISTNHSTTSMAAKLATLIKPQKLIIGHFTSSVNNKKLFLKETSKIFPNTVLASDGLKISINLDHSITLQQES